MAPAVAPVPRRADERVLHVEHERVRARRVGRDGRPRSERPVGQELARDGAVNGDAISSSCARSHANCARREKNARESVSRDARREKRGSKGFGRARAARCRSGGVSRTGGSVCTLRATSFSAGSAYKAQPSPPTPTEPVTISGHRMLPVVVGAGACAAARGRAPRLGALRAPRLAEPLEGLGRDAPPRGVGGSQHGARSMLPRLLIAQDTWKPHRLPRAREEGRQDRRRRHTAPGGAEHSRKNDEEDAAPAGDELADVERRVRPRFEADVEFSAVADDAARAARRPTTTTPTTSSSRRSWPRSRSTASASRGARRSAPTRTRRRRRTTTTTTTRGEEAAAAAAAAARRRAPAAGARVLGGARPFAHAWAPLRSGSARTRATSDPRGRPRRARARPSRGAHRRRRRGRRRAPPRDRRAAHAPRRVGPRRARPARGRARRAAPRAACAGASEPRDPLDLSRALLLSMPAPPARDRARARARGRERGGGGRRRAAAAGAATRRTGRTRARSAARAATAAAAVAAAAAPRAASRAAPAERARTRACGRARPHARELAHCGYSRRTSRTRARPPPRPPRRPARRRRARACGRRRPPRRRATASPAPRARAHARKARESRGEGAGPGAAVSATTRARQPCHRPFRVTRDAQSAETAGDPGCCVPPCTYSHPRHSAPHWWPGPGPHRDRDFTLPKRSNFVQPRFCVNGAATQVAAPLFRRVLVGCRAAS